MKIEINPNGTWYHASNVIFYELKEGSTITQWRALVEAFSHKPTLLSYDDNRDVMKTKNDKLTYKQKENT